jgi:DNA-binding XRE family transcriptional regulator
MAGLFKRTAYRGSPEPLTIKLTRVKAGLTQREAAGKAGISVESWPRYERGERRMPAEAWRTFLQNSGAKVVK